MSAGGRPGPPASRAAYAEVVRTSPLDLEAACLLLSGEVDDAFDPAAAVAEGRAALDALAADARRDVPVGTTALSAAGGLMRALGQRGGFALDASAWKGVEGCLLRETLTRRTGLPILLSLVWVQVARRLGVQADGVGLPGRYVVRLRAPGEPDGPEAGVLVDPSRGGRVMDDDRVAALVRQAAGRSATPEDRRSWDPPATLLRVLGNVVAAGERDDDPERGLATRLWGLDCGLLLPRHPVTLRRRRADVLAEAGRVLEAARTYEEYAGAVEPAQPLAAQRAREAAGLARARLN